MKKVLVLCTGNSCRSQMAEGYLRQFAKDKAELFSAGIEAHGLNPMAERVMGEVGIDISGQTSDVIDKFALERFDFVITVCDNAREKCPCFPGGVIHLHQNFPDPAKAKGTSEEIRQAFREVRDEIKEFCRAFVESQL
jgi:arsenate reductase